jgi:hypothetical protein
MNAGKRSAFNADDSPPRANNISCRREVTRGYDKRSAFKYCIVGFYLLGQSEKRVAVALDFVPMRNAVQDGKVSPIHATVQGKLF